MLRACVQIKLIKSNLIKCKFLRRGEIRSMYPGKNLSDQRREQSNSNHILTPSLEIEPGLHWWEANSLTTTLPLLCKVSHKWSRKRCIWRKALYRCCESFFVCCLTHDLSGTSIPAASLCHLNRDVCTKNYINVETTP